MEINGLVDTSFNEIKPYVYEKPMVPFHEGEPTNDNESREDVEPTTAKSMVMVPSVIPEKLEDFGYSYDRPSNPMALPDQPIQRTTSDPYDEFPGASARIVGKRAGRDYWWNWRNIKHINCVKILMKALLLCDTKTINYIKNIRVVNCGRIWIVFCSSFFFIYLLVFCFDKCFLCENPAFRIMDLMTFHIVPRSKSHSNCLLS